MRRIVYILAILAIRGHSLMNDAKRRRLHMLRSAPELSTSSDSDDEWLRVLCNSKRSPSPPEKFMIDMMRAYNRDNYSSAGEHHRPATQNASPRTSNPHPFADGPCNAFAEVQGGMPWLQAAQWAVAAPPPGGQGWNTGADPAPSAQGSSNLADPAPAPLAPRLPAAQVEPRRSASAATPETPAPTSVGPALPPPGPLELPAWNADSSSESDEEAQRHADREMNEGLKYIDSTEQPSESMVLHLMLKRLKRADSKGSVIGAVYCRQVSFNASVEEVFPWAVSIIDSCRSSGSCPGRARSRDESHAGITRFKVGITHNPSRRWFHRDYGYRGEDWGYMHVLWVSRPSKAASLERQLIAHYKKTTGTREV